MNITLDGVRIDVSGTGSANQDAVRPTCDSKYDLAALLRRASGGRVNAQPGPDELLRVPGKQPARDHQAPGHQPFGWIAAAQQLHGDAQFRAAAVLRVSFGRDGEAIRGTGTIAGPAAAALDFLAEHGGTSQDAAVLSFDLGGGTFDLSAVTVYPNGRQRGSGQTYYYDIVCQNSLEIGGEEFDDRLREIIVGKMGEQPTGALADMLPNAVESIKIDLSGHEAVEPDIMERNGDYYDFTVTRAEFERATKDLVDKMVKMTGQKLEEHPEVSMILLTGGASQMPMIRRALEEAVSRYRGGIITR